MNPDPKLHAVERLDDGRLAVERMRIRVAGGWIYETHINGAMDGVAVAAVFVPDLPGRADV